MREISEEKRKFLESIGVDIHNLPPTFEKYSVAIEDVLSKDEIGFLKKENLTGRYVKRFSLKDLMGTVHPDYADRTWLEAFLLSKRGDRAIKEYFRNPQYYTKDLKQMDQSNLRHESPIELLESNGKFFINGGNNRLSLIMMKYLAEMEHARTNEERDKINEEYTFVAEVQPTPKDKEIMYMLNALTKNMGKDSFIQRTAKDEKPCEYTITTANGSIKINNKDDLEQTLRHSYRLDNIAGIEEFRRNIGTLIGDSYYSPNKGLQEILYRIFPNLQELQENMIFLRGMGLEDELYGGIDLTNISYSQLVNRAAEMAEKEDRKFQEAIEMEKKRQESKKDDSLIGGVDIELFAVNQMKEKVKNNADSIPINLEETYKAFEREESRYADISKKLGLEWTKTRIDDTNTQLGIEQVRSNIQNILQQVQGIMDIERLKSVGNVLSKLNELSHGEDLVNENATALKESFEKALYEKVQKLIRNSKLDRLEQEKTAIENEKITLLGRIMGKRKLQQAMLQNVELKKHILVAEGEKEKANHSLEDSLAELYAYSNCELGRQLTLEMKSFLTIVKTCPQLSSMIDQEELQDFYKSKSQENHKAELPIPLNKKIGNRQQLYIIQIQNAEMSDQIEKDRTKRQKSKTQISFKKEENNRALEKFQSIIKQIKLSTQIEEKQPQREEEQQR